MLKIGVLGAGHLGKIHLKLIKEIDQYELVGFHDLDEENSRKVEEELGVKSIGSVDELIEAVDVVDIVTPTLSHYDCASKAIRNHKHVFVEKPLANTLDEGKAIMELMREADVKGMVGHVERFNPAFLALKGQDLNPAFIETHRLATFNPRGTDVSVILDLMIHDIDVILSMVKANVRKISANGVAVISDTPDIANARVEFDNGTVANLTASRISLKNMRKMRVFQQDAYISIDFLEKKSEIVKMRDGKLPEGEEGLEIDTGNGTKVISIEQPEHGPVNAIKMELETFADSIINDNEPPVTLEDGYRAMTVAYEILDKIALNTLAGNTTI